MINPNTLAEDIIEATSGITEIKRREILATDDELVDLLTDHKETSNILLVGVLPSYGGFGEEDNTGVISYLQFFIVEKVDYKKFKSRDEYIAVFQRTLAATTAFLDAMFNLELANCSNERLEYDFQIRPISRKAGCNGYEIQIDSKAYTDHYGFTR